jgi:hypothetical protein
MTEEAIMNALAQLDTPYRAAEDEEMDTAIDLLRQDLGVKFAGINARFDEVNVRIANSAMESARLIDVKISEFRKEILDNFKAVDARIIESRREMLDNFKLIEARIADSRKEMHDNSRVVEAKIDELRKETSARIDAFTRETTSRIDAFTRETTARIDTLSAQHLRSVQQSDAQFRWLVGVIVASALSMAALLIKTGHW